MSQHVTIARPYAKAVFAVAKSSDDALQVWLQVLQTLSVLMKEQRIEHLVSDPRVTEHQLLDEMVGLVEAVMAGRMGAFGEKVDNFIHLLIEHKRLTASDAIFAIYKKLLAEHQNTLRVDVISAFELSLQQREQLEAALHKRFSSEISARFETDAALIGGAIIRTDDFVMDGSIKGKLARLYNDLMS